MIKIVIIIKIVIKVKKGLELRLLTARMNLKQTLKYFQEISKIIICSKVLKVKG